MTTSSSSSATAAGSGRRRPAAAAAGAALLATGTVLVMCLLLVLAPESHAGPAPPVQQQLQQELQMQMGARAGRSCQHKGRRYEPGEHWATTGAPGQGCAEYECGEDGAVTTTWCGHFQAGPTCRQVRGDARAPYPLCCPQLRCA
ncbi:La1-like protein 13 [Frankliniella fusca]|uniref:La1-like protein 13 n=1 Tax=Frankliniella fusca TaxID=407009 RepID=A0AAE1HIM7_9NEOP|nr:La1-like protein 13 [Frankliniella fusca]